MSFHQKNICRKFISTNLEDCSNMFTVLNQFICVNVLDGTYVTTRTLFCNACLHQFLRVCSRIVIVMVMVFCVKWCIVMVIFILFHTFVILWWFFNEFPFQMFLYVRHATRVTIGNYFLNFTLNNNNNSQLFFNIFNWNSCLCWLFFLSFLFFPMGKGKFDKR